MKKYIIYTDGGARGNPGPAGIGAVVYDEEKNIIAEISEYIGITTNNQAEYKALIAFWKDVSVIEGTQVHGFSESVVRNYVVQFDETKRNEIIKDFQKRVDALQEEIDMYNYTTDIPWGDASEDPNISDEKLLTD